MGGGPHSGLKQFANKMKNMSLDVIARSRGYTFNEDSLAKRDKDLRRRQIGRMQEAMIGLGKYQLAMGESADVIQGAGGTVSLHNFGPNSRTAGDADRDGNIRIKHDMDMIEAEDTMVHEHTHNLVDHILMKETGFKRGTPEFIKARDSAIMYRSINNEAMKDFKDYLAVSANKDLANLKASLKNLEATKQSGVQSLAYMTKFNNLKGRITHLESVIAKSKSGISTPYDAAKVSGMRPYAVHDYSWAPKGAGFEIPTVASEIFHEVKYDWNALKSKNLYAYYVLKHMKNRLK